MSLTFRAIRDLAEDLRTAFADLTGADDEPLFRDVAVSRATSYAGLADQLFQQVRLPAAAICPGDVEVPASGLRHLRYAMFDVYLVDEAAAVPEADVAGDAALAIRDRADAVHAWLHPSTAGVFAPRRIADVDWEWLACTPVDDDACGVLRLRLRATDRLRERD